MAADSEQVTRQVSRLAKLAASAEERLADLGRNLEALRSLIEKMEQLASAAGERPQGISEPQTGDARDNPPSAPVEAQPK